MAQVYSQSYGYNFYFQVIKKASLNLTNLDLGGIGVGKFMDITTLLSNSALVFKTGTGSTLKVIAGGTKTMTKAAIASNEGILTFGAAHGFANGATIVVAGLPSPFAALNGTRVITAVTTTSPFTLKFAFTATNETEAIVNAGTASGAVLALDGTDNPIRLLGLMNAAPSESEGEETIITYDDEAKSECRKTEINYTLGAAVFEYLYGHYSMLDVHELYLEAIRTTDWNAATSAALGLSAEELNTELALYVHALLQEN
jgi:hypothetical protein